jgi:citrate lyase subunit beta/citryl-CoA lyase
MLAKAPSLDADQFVIDLEDAVVPARKDAAREAAAAALGADAWSGLSVAVRINAPRSPWCDLDVCAVVGVARPGTAIVVPKVESAGDLEFIDRLLDGVEARTGAPRLRTHALIETAAGLSRLGEIAAASPRLEALILGYADLSASLRRSAAGERDLDGWRWAQEALLVSARANGLHAIDGPFLGVEADAEFRGAVRRAREIGFDGKWAIHPRQLPVLNREFTPTEEEVGSARQVLAALAEAQREAGAGATALDGRMLDEATRQAALRTLARAEGLEAE